MTGRGRGQGSRGMRVNVNECMNEFGELQRTIRMSSASCNGTHSSNNSDSQRGNRCQEGDRGGAGTE